MHSLVTRLRRGLKLSSKTKARSQSAPLRGELFPPAPAMGAPINGDVVTSVTEASQLAEETVKKHPTSELADLVPDVDQNPMGKRNLLGKTSNLD